MEIKSIVEQIIELTGYSFGYSKYYSNPLCSLIIETGCDPLIQLFTSGYDTSQNYYKFGYWWSEPIKCEIGEIPYTEQFKAKIKNNWD